jgi:hypothetical protein
VPLAFDRHAEEVCRALEEGEVMLDEFVVTPAVDLEHAERPAIALQDDVHRAMDTVLAQDLRRAEALLVLEVVGDHRLAGAQRIACRRGKIGADRRNAHHARLPADSCPNQKAVFSGDKLEDFCEFRTQALGYHAGRAFEQLVDGGTVERCHTQCGQDLLLPDALL